jgi:hypothetical protein
MTQRMQKKPPSRPIAPLPRTIIQIMPAGGWTYMMQLPSGQNSTHPLIGWALVENGVGARGVVGLAAAEKSVMWADQVPGFIAYKAP